MEITWTKYHLDKQVLSIQIYLYKGLLLLRKEFWKKYYVIF
jgi:hypothetical protein